MTTDRGPILAWAARPAGVDPRIRVDLAGWPGETETKPPRDGPDVRATAQFVVRERKRLQPAPMLAVEASDEAPAEGVAERLVVRICVVVIGVKLTAWLALIGYGLWHLISD